MKNNLLVLASTSILILTVCGYQFVTTLFLPVNDDLEVVSRSVTVPYRLVVLLLCIYVILFSKHTLQWNNNIKLFFFFWLIYLIRIFYDIYIRPDAVATHDYNTNTMLFIGGIIFPVMIAIYRGFSYINFRKAFIACFIISTCTLLLSLYNNEILLAKELAQRVDGNVALNTISFGHLGVTNILLAFLLFNHNKIFSIKNIAVFFIVLLSFFCMLRTGSRGPFVTLCLLIILCVFARIKNKTISIIIVGIIILTFYLFQDIVIQILGDISPILRARLESGDSSGRENLYSHALSLFYSSPLWGSSYVVDGFYSHNMLLDALIGMGIWGGATLSVIYFKCLRRFTNSLRNKDEYRWIHLLLIQAIIGGMFSGAFYNSALLSMMIVIVFLIKKHKMADCKKQMY